MRNLAAWAAYIAAREKVPFEWGTHDCVTFAAGAVQALTGHDPLVDIPRWDGEKAALTELKRRDGLMAAVSGMLAEVPVAMAHRGDIGAVEGERGPLLVVIEGMTLTGPGPDGLERYPRALLINAWSAE